MAIVIPEIGFDEVPIRPVMRDDTVTKRNPKTITRIAARKLPWIASLEERVPLMLTPVCME